MEIDGFITIDKAVKWLKNNLYGGFDSMCLDFRTKDECIALSMTWKTQITESLQMIGMTMTGNF